MNSDSPAAARTRGRPRTVHWRRPMSWSRARPGRFALAVLAGALGLLPFLGGIHARALADPAEPVTGNATYFFGLGGPYGGCGMTEDQLETQRLRRAQRLQHARGLRVLQPADAGRRPEDRHVEQRPQLRPLGPGDHRRLLHRRQRRRPEPAVLPERRVGRRQVQRRDPEHARRGQLWRRQRLVPRRPVPPRSATTSRSTSSSRTARRSATWTPTTGTTATSPGSSSPRPTTPATSRSVSCRARRPGGPRSPSRTWPTASTAWSPGSGGTWVDAEMNGDMGQAFVIKPYEPGGTRLLRPGPRRQRRVHQRRPGLHLRPARQPATRSAPTPYQQVSYTTGRPRRPAPSDPPAAPRGTCTARVQGQGLLARRVPGRGHRHRRQLEDPRLAGDVDPGRRPERCAASSGRELSARRRQAVTVQNETWNGGLAPGPSTTFGFVVDGGAGPPALNCATT